MFINSFIEATPSESKQTRDSSSSSNSNVNSLTQKAFRKNLIQSQT